MGSPLFLKFQELVKSLAKSSTFSKNPRQLQFEADVNRLFLYTSYNSLGKDAEEKDAEEIIDIAHRASVSDQQKQVQQNIHSQIQTFCKTLDEILLPDPEDDSHCISSQQSPAPNRPSGLSYAVGNAACPKNIPVTSGTLPLRRLELSKRFKETIRYTLELKPSQISHEGAGLGIFLNGSSGIGSVVAFYPGLIYSPAYYRYIPGYPRIDVENSYLISRYDGTVIDAQPWGIGGENREQWSGLLSTKGLHASNVDPAIYSASDRVWRLLSKPLDGDGDKLRGTVLERRNPLAFGHYANHPEKGTDPNVMICPYDFPLAENVMRPYIPNVMFGGDQEVKMKRYGTFWLKSSSVADEGMVGPIMRTLVLVATRELCDEELFLNYRLSNLKRRPSWYNPVDEEEDKRRWS